MKLQKHIKADLSKLNSVKMNRVKNINSERQLNKIMIGMICDMCLIMIKTGFKKRLIVSQHMRLGIMMQGWRRQFWKGSQIRKNGGMSKASQ